MIPDLKKYAENIADPSVHGYSTDLEHLAHLWATVEEVEPKVIVEVGSWKGGSACLWVSALEQGMAKEVHLFEPKPRPELIRLINGSSKADRVVLHTCSYHLFPLYADLIWIDGDHQWPAFADLAAALAMQCGIIAMHDTLGFTTGNYNDCWGSWMAANILRQAREYRVFEDNKPRPGARTDRGLMIAARA